MTPTLAPGTPVRRRDGAEFRVHAAGGLVVFLIDADGQIEAARADEFRPLYEVVGATEPATATPEGVQDFIARTVREAAR